MAIIEEEAKKKKERKKKSKKTTTKHDKDLEEKLKASLYRKAWQELKDYNSSGRTKINAAYRILALEGYSPSYLRESWNRMLGPWRLRRF